MKAREYTETKFIPWILFLEPNDTIKHFQTSKEAYLMETYNHISGEFKAIDRYDLYMFRVTFSNQLTPDGLYDLIICKLPEVKGPNESAYLILAHQKDKIIYYLAQHLVTDDYQIKKITKNNKETIATLSNPSLEDVLKIVKGNLLDA